MIYRVENRDGWGPWSAMETADYPWYDDKGRSRHNTFPRPEIDIGIREHVPFCGWWDRFKGGINHELLKALVAREKGQKVKR